MKSEQVFDMKAEKIRRLPDGMDKYALIGFFREQQRQMIAPREDGSVPPVVIASPAGTGSNTVAMPATRTTAPVCMCKAIVNSTLTDWLLAFIAFLLILQLVTRE